MRFSLLFQVPNWIHIHTNTRKNTHTVTHRGTHTGTHTGTDTHRDTRTGTHTHTGTHIQEHTQEHTHTGTHIHLDKAGWPSQRAPRSRAWGFNDVKGLHHMHGCLHRGLLLHALLQLCHPLGQRCSAGNGGAHLQVEPVWTQPSEFCSSVLGLTWHSRVGTATEHRSLCSHWALALACAAPSHRGDSCQHNLGRIDLWPTQLQLCHKALCTQTPQGWVHTRTALQNWNR